MNCPRCGAYIGPAQRFCTGCGRDTAADRAPAGVSGQPAPTTVTPTYSWDAGTPLPPPGSYNTISVPVSRQSGRRRRADGSRFGPLGAGAVGILALLSKLKGLLVLLKFGKFGGTAITMLVSVWAYAVFFGFPFAVGFVALILVHEMGHWIAMRAKGVPAGAPVFIPFLGALIAMRGLPRNVKDEAEIGIAGPIAGTAASLLVGIAGALVADPTAQAFLYALGYTGLLLNLFNLIPVSPLDGGRVAGAISRWAWPVGLALLLVLFITHPSGILLLILLLGGFETFNRFMRADRYQAIPGYYTIAPRERIALAIVLFGLIVVAFGGMDLFHNQLLAIQGGSI